MSLHFSVLASGSTGNALYVGTDKQKLLVDAGLSGKATEALFEQAELNIQDISGILVTHEHSDHIKGLGVLARKYNLPVYANEKDVECDGTFNWKHCNRSEVHFFNW